MWKKYSGDKFGSELLFLFWGEGGVKGENKVQTKF